MTCFFVCVNGYDKAEQQRGLLSETLVWRDMVLRMWKWTQLMPSCFLHDDGGHVEHGVLPASRRWMVG
jgi:hypothetical protein